MVTKTEKFGKKVLDKYTACITDQIFLYIQSDAHLLKEYRALIKEAGNQRFNSVFGKMITEAYHLENDGLDHNPECTLLTKYTKHKLQRPKKKAITDDVPDIYKGSDLFAPPKKNKKLLKIREALEPKPKPKAKPKKTKKGIEEAELF